MTEADNEQIEAAKAALDKATPGPWITEYGEVIQECSDISSDQRDIAYLNMDAGDSDNFGSAIAAKNNGVLLAAAPALVRRVQELEDWQAKALDYLLSMRASLADLLKEYWQEGDDLSANILKARLDPLTTLIEQAEGGK